MKRTALSLLVAGAIACGMVLFGSPSTAKADHRRKSVGVFVGPGGFNVGVGVGSPYHVRHRPVVFYGEYGNSGYGNVPPTCCHYERCTNRRIVTHGEGTPVSIGPTGCAIITADSWSIRADRLASATHMNSTK